MIATYRDGPCGCEESVALRARVATLETHSAVIDSLLAQTCAPLQAIGQSRGAMPGDNVGEWAAAEITRLAAALDAADMSLRVDALESAARSALRALTYSRHSDLSAQRAAVQVLRAALDEVPR